MFEPRRLPGGTICDLMTAGGVPPLKKDFFLFFELFNATTFFILN